MIVDCGCAPGSWSQVASVRCNATGANEKKPKGIVIGVDLVQVYPLEHAILMGNTDFTTDKGQQKILEVLKGRKINVVLSDMAPKATGIRALDQENIIQLCYAVLRFAAKMSEIDGTLLMKFWSGGDVPRLTEDMKKFYKSVKIVKPSASRGDSAEQFVLGKGFVGLES